MDWQLRNDSFIVRFLATKAPENHNAWRISSKIPAQTRPIIITLWYVVNLLLAWILYTFCIFFCSITVFIGSLNGFEWVKGTQFFKGLIQSWFFIKKIHSSSTSWWWIVKKSITPQRSTLKIPGSKLLHFRSVTSENPSLERFGLTSKVTSSGTFQCGSVKISK